MKRENRYSKRDFDKDFGTDEKCLEFVFNALHTKKCSCGGEYKPIQGRKQFQCSKCRNQIAPMKGTIFEKSSTHLSLWFHAVWVFSNAKSGISSYEMERQLGVTLKCAWRILHLIRKTLKQEDGNFLSGDVEMDEMYFGGHKYAGKNYSKKKESMGAKAKVVGAVERGGTLKVKVVDDLTAHTIGDFLQKNINPITSRLMTDTSNRYDKVAKGHSRYAVNHHKREFVRGEVHTNTIDSFWGHVKRSIKGTHKAISKRYLQQYLDSFVFHYNNRDSDRQRFFVLLGKLLHAEA